MKPDLGRLGQVLDPPGHEGDDGETDGNASPLETAGLIRTPYYENA